MIRRSTTFALLLAATAYLAVPVSAQMHDHPGRANTEPRVSPNASVSQTVGTAVFSIEYGRPAVKGRVVFGELEPFGKVWRSGANEATTIVVPVDVTIEGQALPAGVYALMTIPGESAWSIIFNTEAKQWGAFKHNPDMDALRVTVEPQEAPHQELLTYTFENVTQNAATVVLHWGTTAVPFRIEIPE